MVYKFVLPSTIQVVDSHTAGEPTRVVVDGGPALGAGALDERLRRFASEHDEFRSAVVNEPRGSDVLVGALLCEPEDKSCAAGALFFNNVGYLGMCGHGTMGVVVTLAHLGRIKYGQHRIETPVGVVCATLHPDGKVTVENVPSYRYKKSVAVDVPSFGSVTGDIAWGGNWFFIVDNPPVWVSFDNIDQLTEFSWAIRKALGSGNITGAGGDEIDHIELSAASSEPGVDSRNFVLCPGKAYDRSPCGTGTSAKLACLADDGKLAPGQTWRQQGILDTVFEGSYQRQDGKIVPSITGSAYVTAEARLIIDPHDPFRTGIHA
ncbi:MAG: proline racemase family protein [Acidobacteriaceae bacterium]